MGLNTHDLLRIKDISVLEASGDRPEWVHAALKQAPYVVIRRSKIQHQRIPVGVRGRNRNERYSCFLPKDNILERMTPKELAYGRSWRRPDFDYPEMRNALNIVDDIFTLHKLVWGPVGSVGFELTSQCPTIKPTSDLDLIIKTPELLPVRLAKQLVADLLLIKVRVDVLLEMPEGAVSLMEYARGENNVLLRTVEGPRFLGV